MFAVAMTTLRKLTGCKCSSKPSKPLFVANIMLMVPCFIWLCVASYFAYHDVISASLDGTMEVYGNETRCMVPPSSDHLAIALTIVYMTPGLCLLSLFLAARLRRCVGHVAGRPVRRRDLEARTRQALASGSVATVAALTTVSWLFVGLCLGLSAAWGLTSASKFGHACDFHASPTLHVIVDTTLNLPSLAVLCRATIPAVLCFANFALMLMASSFEKLSDQTTGTTDLEAPDARAASRREPLIH